MNKLKSGEYYGAHYQKSIFDNVILSDTEYTHSKVDWHYHENPYFTYLLQGKLFESNKKESYHLESGDLLFHNWQDAHYNVKPPIYTRGFHIELNQNWFDNFDVKQSEFEGSLNLRNPIIKNLMNKIFVEFKINDALSLLSIESLLLEVFATIKETDLKPIKKPIWVDKLENILLEEEFDYTLINLSTILNIHPVHLSREFSRYFGVTLGYYIRIMRLNKAFSLIAANQFSMTEICYKCGFYDQSHFISNFKRIYKTTPSKLLRKFE